MKSQFLVKVTIACFLSTSFLLPSCTKEIEKYEYPTNPGGGVVPTVMNVQLTGASSSTTFSKVNVDVQALQFNTSSEAGITEGWEAVSLQQPGSIDILSFLNGRSLRLNADMLPGDVKQLRVVFGDNNSVEINGEVKPLHVSTDLKETGLVIFVETDQSADYSNSLWLNFDATQSVSYDAVSNEYSLVPAIYTFDENKSGAIEGFVAQIDAKATVQLEADLNTRNALVNVTTFADSQNQGYFKFVGVPEGTYHVVVVAGDGTNRRKEVNDIQVKVTETNNLGSVELQ